MIRLAHFSDIHLISSQLEWRLGDWFSKRFTSWMNHRFRGRARRFALADEIVPRLMDDLLARAADHLVFSGDATILGFESEIRRAAELLRIGQIPIPGLAVPGNHDYLTRRSAESGAFERYFGVNAATGNRLPWDARGTVGADQRTRLQQLLAELPAGLKILVIHYPICLSTGLPEGRFHALRDLDAMLRVARAGGVNLWLHGHRHTPYYFQQPAGVPFPVICAGTATQYGIWSYNEYAIQADVLQAMRRTYDPEGRCFRAVETFTLKLR
jgi:3',5'-cyclic AMP phosphodiesterase CpdA